MAVFSDALARREQRGQCTNGRMGTQCKTNLHKGRESYKGRSSRMTSRSSCASGRDARAAAAAALTPSEGSWNAATKQHDWCAEP